MLRPDLPDLDEGNRRRDAAACGARFSNTQARPSSIGEDGDPAPCRAFPMETPLDVDLLPAGDPGVDAELDDFFERCPRTFAQQTTGWRDVVAGIDRDEPLFLACRRNGALIGVLPAYRFAGALGAILNSVPQAGPLGGVACLSEVDSEPVYRTLLAAYVDLARRTGCASATVISNPFWPDESLYAQCFEPDYELENVCQVLDLEEAVDANGSFVRANAHLQRNLRKALSGRLLIDEEQTAANVDEWYEIHFARHTEIGVRPLPKALFVGALRHMVPRDKARFFFVRLDGSGQMIGGGFYVYHGAVMDALMPSISGEHAGLGAAYVLASHSILWAKRRGIRLYNWQPSPPDGGVYRFKRQWGSRDVPYRYLTRITGNIEPILNSSPEQIAAAYPWHFVLPFDRLGTPASPQRGKSTREEAWTAREEGRK